MLILMDVGTTMAGLYYIAPLTPYASLVTLIGVSASVALVKWIDAFTLGAFEGVENFIDIVSVRPERSAYLRYSGGVLGVTAALGGSVVFGIIAALRAPVPVWPKLRTLTRNGLLLTTAGAAITAGSVYAELNALVAVAFPLIFMGQDLADILASDMLGFSPLPTAPRTSALARRRKRGEDTSAPGTVQFHLDTNASWLVFVQNSMGVWNGVHNNLTAESENNITSFNALLAGGALPAPRDRTPTSPNLLLSDTTPLELDISVPPGSGRSPSPDPGDRFSQERRPGENAVVADARRAHTATIQYESRTPSALPLAGTAVLSRRAARKAAIDTRKRAAALRRLR